MKRTKKMPDRQAISIRFPDDEVWIMQALEAEAKADSRSVASMLRRILAERYQDSVVDPEGEK